MLPLRSWWHTLGVAATLLCVATVGTAATFTLSDGDVIEGEIVQATRNTLVIREKVGGLRQLSRRQMNSIQVETKKGQTISGPLMSWQDGTYEIEYGGRLVQVRDRLIINVTPIPPKQAVAETETVEKSNSSESEPAAAEDAAPLKTAEMETAAVDVAAPPPMPTGSETKVDENADLPKLTVSEVQAGENMTEMVFKLDLSRPADQPIMILYATYDKTAVAGEDYKGERGTMTLAPGTSSTVVRVPLINDDVLEENETLELFVATDKRHAIIEVARTVGTILNDD